MLTQHTVSLLVPCFNAKYYVSDFIENMSQQTRPFDEIMFYDDGSSDGTTELLRQQNFGRVIYGKCNRGPSIVRNILLRASTGQLIHFHDVDDWLEPTFLEETLRALTKEWDVVITNIRVMDRATGKNLHLHDYSELISSNDPLKFFLTHCCYPINGLYRREVLEKIGGFRESLSRDEDPDLHIRLAHSGVRIRSLPLPLAINRFGAGTYSSTSYVACWREHLKALQYYAAELPQQYYSLLRTDSARMVGLCAASGDLKLAYDYLDFCQYLEGREELWIATSVPMKPLVKILGYRNALNLRFGAIGRKIRKIWPWVVG